MTQQNQVARIVKNGATISATGSEAITMPPGVALALLINVLHAPTGTNPTLTVSITEVDPIDQTTAMSGAASSAALSAAGVEKVFLPAAFSGTYKVTWTIGGTSSPTFTGVNISVVPLADGSEGEGKPLSLTDVTPTGSATAFGSLARGPSGIMVTMHPSSSGEARVSGTDVATNKGTPLIPGSSVIFDVSNANKLKHILVSGTPNLCVTAV